MNKKTKQNGFKFDSKKYQKEYHMLSMAPELNFGVTRRERQLKQLLMMSLDQLRTTNNLEELRYWLTEWEPQKYPFIRFINVDKVWQGRSDGVQQGWSPHHDDLCAELVRDEP